MLCRSCQTMLQEGANYCHKCGKKQEQESKKRHHHRAQSEGTITKLSGQRKNPYWARMPADYSTGVPERKSLGCFSTYKAAAEALAKAMYVPSEDVKNEKRVLLLQRLW